MSISAETPYANIARVVKTQGLKGEVVVVPTSGLPFLLSEGMEVFLTPPPLRGIRSAKVLSVREMPNGHAVLFSGVSDINTASGLAGRLVLATRTELPTFEIEVAAFTPVGYRVEDITRGYIGDVTEVLETGANDVWIIEGPYGEVLIPVIESVVLDIPKTSDSPISVRLLEGLMPDEEEFIEEFEEGEDL